MRVLIITDSLGCPREEIDVSKTWTDMLLSKWSRHGIVFYTQCMHGLSLKKIDLNYISEISPDVVVFQVGIVDACRRAQTKVEFHLFSGIPYINKIIKRFCSKHHYFLTKIRNIHDCSTRDFKKILQNCCNKTGKLYYIKIAPPGKALIQKVFNVTRDVDEYNNIAQAVIPVDQWVDPYVDLTAEDFLLSDGHHLTEYGHQMVFDAVNKIIEREVK